MTSRNGSNGQQPERGADDVAARAILEFGALILGALAVLWCGHALYEYGTERRHDPEMRILRGEDGRPLYDFGPDGRFPFESRPGYWRTLGAHLMIEIGVAGLIAVLLALTIDRRLKSEVRVQFERNQEAIQENVFRHVYGFSLPKEVVMEIESQLLRHSFIREKLMVSYEIRPYAGDPDHFVKVITTLEYDVRNTSTHPEDYPITWYSDAPSDPAHRGDCALISFECWCDGQRVAARNQTQLMDEARQDKVEGHYVWEGKYAIPPQKSAHLVRRMSSVKRRDYDYDVFITDNPTAVMIFRVDLDGSLELDVQAYPFHPKPFKEHHDHDPAQGRYRWTVEAPILCFQGGFVTWKKKRVTRLPALLPATATTAADATPMPVAADPQEPVTAG
jgi:hypothetical protein